jgi:hypothetical protein
VQYFIRDLDITKEKKKPSLKLPVQPTVKKWVPPPVGFTKINVDAAVWRNQNFGAVAEDCQSWRWYGLWRASVVVIQGISDPATLEAMACRDALALARALSLERVKLHQIALKLSQV